MRLFLRYANCPRGQLASPAALVLLLAAKIFAGDGAAARPRIAVVIDDFGLNYKTTPADEKWLALPFPITCAVMPESPLTTKVALMTKKSGHELIIHFPFDPFQALDLPKDKVSESDVAKVRALLEKSFKQIEGPAGLNNHRSYLGTKNRPLMEAFMGLLKGRVRYFLDSKVSNATVAYDEARKAGIPAAKNYIFMEEPGHYNDKPFAAKMLRQAAARARREGSAIIIGHHYYKGTYDALVEEVPKLQQEGFEFVYASALAH